MRSQATKPLPKKGALRKVLKVKSPPRPAKKKVVATKKLKLVKKSLVKRPKKQNDSSDSKTEEDSSAAEKSESGSDGSRAGTSKVPKARSESPKKAKKEPKEKKESLKTIDVVKGLPEKSTSSNKTSPKTGMKKRKKNSDDIKYKINTGMVKKAPKVSKPKKPVKKSDVVNQRKKTKVISEEVNESPKMDVKEKSEPSQPAIENKNNEILDCQSSETKAESSMDVKSDSTINTNTTSNVTKTPEKSEPERPPKFFTSTRSPRVLDIDVRCCKNSNVFEKFISTKSVETKTNEDINSGSSSNNLISQGPDIDVYTFTEKVDSPKSILSDFRNPMSKNIGRVRPIARVKGTVIDKKIETEKKKYSPHRPIEEVVKQLKAKKGSEELKSSQTETSDNRSSVDSSIVSDEKEEEEKPKAIISKSYKMVARKTSIPGKPFSPIKFLDSEDSGQSKGSKGSKSNCTAKKSPAKGKSKPSSMSDEELDNSKFSFNTKTKSRHYSSSEEGSSESNDENDSKESSESESNKNKKSKKTRKYKKVTDGAKKYQSKELRELAKDTNDLTDDLIFGNDKPSKRRLKLLSMWSGPKKHRMASLNAMAKVHCLYENESRTHLELGLLKTVDRFGVPGPTLPSTSKKKEPKPKETQEMQETTSESEYEMKEKKEDSSEDDTPPPSTRSLRGMPGIRSAGKYWDPKSSNSSSEDSEMESRKKATLEKKKSTPKTATLKSENSDSEKTPPKMKKTAGVPLKKKRNRNEVTMDLKDMVVQKRMASLNATAILAASYEKRSPASKSSKDETTSDSCSDESFSQKSKNGVGSGVKSESKIEEPKKEVDDSPVTDKKQKVDVIVNQDTDVTITGVYATHHHEGFCTVSGLQYRISSTSHTQTTATANCEKEGCSREDGSRYTPLSALSSMQPPADQDQPHPATELGGLSRRPGCSSAFTAPSPSAHHEPGYYQPAGPLIKETGPEAERALARYHPPPHYHPPHTTVLQQYGPPYYPTELCYGRYYGPRAPYHMPPPPPTDSQMVGVGGEPYPPPQYYGGPPCYQHSPQRLPYIEYRGCPCPMNACPKNVLIGPATGKAPVGGGPDAVPNLAPPGAAFRTKVRACAGLDAAAARDSHGSGKDPPLEALLPPSAADAPRLRALPASPPRPGSCSRARRRGSLTREPAGPPSPARGSAGACAPQPPPGPAPAPHAPPHAPPRRARLGKDMARRERAVAVEPPGDTAAALLRTPPAATLATAHSDADDDVLAVSPPTCAPIDLSSSDETDRRSTPLVDVKKENEGPTCSPPRKPDAQALKESNSAEAVEAGGGKPTKRRYSRPKLEIELGEVPLEDGRRTNGIGEHVKLQKRRKVSSEQTEPARAEALPKETKKRSPKARRAPKQPAERKSAKRKLEPAAEEPRPKKMSLEIIVAGDVRVKNVAAMPQDAAKPKNKSALLLDNLLRKNSIDRADPSVTDPTEINPAELFLPKDNVLQSCTKKLNINNNVIENGAPNERVNGVRPKTIAAVTQMIGKKLASKNSVLNSQKVESKVLSPVKSLLNSSTEKSTIKEEVQPTKPFTCSVMERDSAIISQTEKCEAKRKDTSDSVSNQTSDVTDNVLKSLNKQSKKQTKSKSVNKLLDPTPPIEITIRAREINERLEHSTAETNTPETRDTQKTITFDDKVQPEKITKRSKLSIDKPGEHPRKSIEKCEKVAKLMAPKKFVIKTDEAAAFVEEACSSPIPRGVRRAKRRRSGTKRARRIPDLLPPPLASTAPRWSNGWQWDGDHYVSKVYLNNDSRQDRTARCWSRMTHTSGDQISRGDCVLLRASSAAKAQPFVAKVASMWENPEDGEMMVSLVWYYRPEHTERGRMPEDAPDEVFGSRHRDANSVATIEDKCYVLTFNEYSRYRKRLKATEMGITIPPSIVPPLPSSEYPDGVSPDARVPPTVPPELVLFCHKIYDFRSKKLAILPK